MREKRSCPPTLVRLSGPPKVLTGHDYVSLELFDVMVVGRRVDVDDNNDSLLASKHHAHFTR